MNAQEARAAANDERKRTRAEEAIAERLPVAFAVWDTCERGDVSPGVLAQRLGVPPARVRLLVEVADHLIDLVETRGRRALPAGLTNLPARGRRT